MGVRQILRYFSGFVDAESDLPKPVLRGLIFPFISKQKLYAPLYLCRSDIFMNDMMAGVASDRNLLLADVRDCTLKGP